ncbi:GET complex subunit get1, partial [Cryomyces antarcticus]
GWVPGYVEWILSFPRAPIGSISIQVWGIACASVVKIVGEAVAAGLVLNSKQPVGGAREPQAFGAGQQEKSAAGVKKEL